jgi:predicted DNA-binding transcriptional regulator YafY
LNPGASISVQGCRDFGGERLLDRKANDTATVRLAIPNPSISSSRYSSSLGSVLLGKAAGQHSIARAATSAAVIPSAVMPESRSRSSRTARMTSDIAATISVALKASERLRIVHLSRGSTRATARVVEPYGVLIGARRYLVAKTKSDPDGPVRHYVAENIRSAQLTGEYFERDRDFKIDLHAQKAFGTFQNEAEIDDVIWKFRRDAADHAGPLFSIPPRFWRISPMAP